MSSHLLVNSPGLGSILCVHLALVRGVSRQLALIAVAGAIGLVADSLLMSWGVLRYPNGMLKDAPELHLPPPGWYVARTQTSLPSSKRSVTT
jgi:hypothetical protein